jgi:hypothetical protein
VYGRSETGNGPIPGCACIATSIDAGFEQPVSRRGSRDARAIPTGQEETVDLDPQTGPSQREVVPRSLVGERRWVSGLPRAMSRSLLIETV